MGGFWPRPDTISSANLVQTPWGEGKNKSVTSKRFLTMGRWPPSPSWSCHLWRLGHLHYTQDNCQPKNIALVSGIDNEEKEEPVQCSISTVQCGQHVDKVSSKDWPTALTFQLLEIFLTFLVDAGHVEFPSLHLDVFLHLLNGCHHLTCRAWLHHTLSLTEHPQLNACNHVPLRHSMPLAYVCNRVPLRHNKSLAECVQPCAVAAQHAPSCTSALWQEHIGAHNLHIAMP